MRNTLTYQHGKFVRREKLCTLREFLELDRLKVGQCILIGNINLDSGNSSNTMTIWIGDATLYHEPSTNDGGFGWDYEHPNMNKYVLEVHEHGTV